jgi:hypothetical protein
MLPKGEKLRLAHISPAIRQGIREVEHDILAEEPDQLAPIVFLEASESQPTSGNDLGIVHLVFLLPTSVLLGASSKLFD